MLQLPNEPQYGPVEYKTEITVTNPERLQELATQLKFRLEEGNGEAFYFIGVADNGTVLGLSKEKLEKSIANLKVVTELVGATIVDMRIEQVSEGKYVGEVLIREEKKVVPIEVKVAVLGHVNAGKSTLTGAILTGKLDNGDGLLRNLVARYLHEVVTGRTSSVTMRVLGFSKSNIPVNWSLRDPLSEADAMRRLQLYPYNGYRPSLLTFNIYVYDASSGAQLPDARVFISDTEDRIKGSIRGVTDNDGRLVLREAVPYYNDDTYIISVFGPGYEPYSVNYTGQQLAGLKEVDVKVGLNPSKYGVVTISYEVLPHYEVRSG